MVALTKSFKRVCYKYIGTSHEGFLGQHSSLNGNVLLTAVLMAGSRLAGRVVTGGVSLPLMLTAPAIAFLADCFDKIIHESGIKMERSERFYLARTFSYSVLYQALKLSGSPLPLITIVAVDILTHTFARGTFAGVIRHALRSPDREQKSAFGSPFFYAGVAVSGAAICYVGRLANPVHGAIIPVAVTIINTLALKVMINTPFLRDLDGHIQRSIVTAISYGAVYGGFTLAGAPISLATLVAVAALSNLGDSLLHCTFKQAYQARYGQVAQK
jgi:hypothetical protein